MEDWILTTNLLFIIVKVTLVILFSMHFSVLVRTLLIVHAKTVKNEDWEMPAVLILRPSVEIGILTLLIWLQPIIIELLK